MDGEEQRLLTIQPVFPYFLRTKLGEIEESTQRALYEGFKAHYRGVVEKLLVQLMRSKDSQEKQLGLFFLSFGV